MTQLKLTNQTSDDVITYITLGATPSCVQDVTQLIFSDTKIELIKLADLMGHFILKSGSTTYVSAPQGDGFNGNISFNTPPMNCKSAELPYGMNLAEFIINNGFQAGNPQETIDNSCVAGANAIIKFKMDTNDWGANYGKVSNIQEFVNGVWDDNSERVGVFPYGCDNCTESTSPPSCVGLQPQNVNKEPICNVQRSAVDNQGGTLEIIFEGLF